MLTVKECADIMRVCPRTIYRVIRDGKLKASRIGRQWRVGGKDLDLLSRTSEFRVQFDCPYCGCHCDYPTSYPYRYCTWCKGGREQAERDGVVAEYFIEARENLDGK